MATGQTIKTSGLELTIADSGAVHRKIGGCNNINGLSAAVAKIMLDDFDNTIMSSRPGRRKAGECTIDLLLDFDDTGQAEAEAVRVSGAQREFKLVFTEGVLATLTFNARVTNFTINGTDDDVYKGQITLKVTSKPVKS